MTPRDRARDYLRTAREEIRDLPVVLTLQTLQEYRRVMGLVLDASIAVFEFADAMELP